MRVSKWFSLQTTTSASEIALFDALMGTRDFVFGVLLVFFFLVLQQRALKTFVADKGSDEEAWPCLQGSGENGRLDERLRAQDREAAKHRHVAAISGNARASFRFRCLADFCANLLVCLPLKRFEHSHLPMWHFVVCLRTSTPKKTSAPMWAVSACLLTVKIAGESLVRTRRYLE